MNHFCVGMNNTYQTLYNKRTNSPNLNVEETNHFGLELERNHFDTRQYDKRTNKDSKQSVHNNYIKQQ